MAVPDEANPCSLPIAVCLAFDRGGELGRNVAFLSSQARDASGGEAHGGKAHPSPFRVASRRSATVPPPVMTTPSRAGGREVGGEVSGS